MAAKIDAMKLKRLFLKYNKASIRYNRDANIRVMREQDAKAKELGRKCEEAFNELMAELKSAIS